MWNYRFSIQRLFAREKSPWRTFAPWTCVPWNVRTWERKCYGTLAPWELSFPRIFAPVQFKFTFSRPINGHYKKTSCITSQYRRKGAVILRTLSAGTKVPRVRKLQGTEVPWVRKFQEAKVPGSEKFSISTIRSQERKVSGAKSPHTSMYNVFRRYVLGSDWRWWSVWCTLYTSGVSRIVI